MNGIIGEGYFSERVQCISRRGYVVLGQGAAQPVIGDTRQGAGIGSANGIDCLVQWPGVGFPMKLDCCERYFCINIGRLNGQRAIQHSYFFRIAPENSVTKRDLLAREKSCADRKSTRLNSSHLVISYAVFCL